MSSGQRQVSTTVELLAAATRILPAQTIIDDGDMRLIRALPQEQQTALGPFVMDTPERLEQAKRDFAAGRMGRLVGVPF